MKTNNFILLFAVFFLISCAQIVPLSGGDQDIEPPKEVESSPLNGSTYFSSDEIIVEFDEFIQLQNLQSQLVVSPYMENEPEVKIRGKKLIIELKDSLLPNTTYSLNFGSAIVDITENNAIPNYKYVFSTGSYVDSLSYSGTVVNAFDLKPVEQTSILLYTQFEDSVPYLERPRYIAITDKEGNFEITNIAHGEYKLFAIKDINSNYLFDLPNEEVAFEKEAVVINESSSNHQLHLFEEQATEQFVVMSEHKQFGGVRFVLNKPTKQLEVTHFSEEDPPLYIESNSAGDTIHAWMRQPQGVGRIKNYTDFVSPLEAFEVSDSSYVIDTISTDVYTKLEDSLFNFTSNIQGKFDLNASVRLVAPRPLDQEVNWNALILLEDSIPVSNFNTTLEQHKMRSFLVAYPFKEEKNYDLTIPKGAFKDIYGVPNDSVTFSFKTKAMSDYGKIALTVNPNFEHGYIVQLMRGTQVLSQQTAKGNAVVNFEFIRPGNYSLKLIVDENKDGKWTTGHYLSSQQPETVIFYEKDIAIKPNWDNEITWTIKK